VQLQTDTQTQTHTDVITTIPLNRFHGQSKNITIKSNNVEKKSSTF